MEINNSLNIIFNIWETIFSFVWQYITIWKITYKTQSQLCNEIFNVPVRIEVKIKVPGLCQRHGGRVAGCASADLL